MAATVSTEPLLLPSEAKKVVVVGSAGSGKTALVTRYASGTFIDEYQQTFGADLLVKQISSETNKHTVNIWCCGGHERYRALLEQFYVEAHSAILCFDMLSVKSFADLPFWYNEIQRVCPDAAILLVGTKSDDVDNVKVNAQDAVKQAAEWGVQFRSVSAKTESGVNELFMDLVDLLS